MFQVLGIDHVVLRVADRHRALAFYQEVIGLTVERDQPEVGLTQLRAGRSLIDLVESENLAPRTDGAASDGQSSNVDHFALEIAPYDDVVLRTHLARFGLDIVEAGSRYGAGGEGPAVYVLDPDGNKIELKGPASKPQESREKNCK